MTGMAREESHEPAIIRVAYLFLALGFCSVVFWNGTKAAWGYSEVTTMKSNTISGVSLSTVATSEHPEKRTVSP